jgi:hypothetical protein
MPCPERVALSGAKSKWNHSAESLGFAYAAGVASRPVAFGSLGG